MDRKNYTFDASKIVNYLPSIWGKNYKDRATLEKLYEAFARVTEADYASVFQVDDAKDLSTLPALTYYPVVYEKLEDWESYGTEHAHTQIEVAFDSSITVQRAGESYFVVRVPDTYLRGDVQLYADGRLIPSDCYVIESAPYVELVGSPALTTEIDGSTIFFHVSRLTAFVTSGTDADQENDQSPPSSIDDLTTISIYTLKTSKPFRFVADGSTNEYSLEGFDAATRLVPQETRVLLESIDAGALFSYTSTTDDTQLVNTYTISAINPAGLNRGAIVKLYFQDGSDVYVKRAQLPANQSAFTVQFSASATLTGIHLLINFELGQNLVDLREDGFTLKGTNVFFPGARIRVTDDTGVQSFTVERTQNAIKFDRVVDVDTTSISFLGVNILDSGVSASAITFDGVPTKNVHILVDATIANDHAHGHQQILIATDDSPATSIELSVEDPMVIDPLAAGYRSEFFPARVFVDGRLIPTTEYDIQSSVTIDFFTPLNIGNIVDVHYLNQEELIQHRHAVLSDTVAADVEEQFSFEFEIPVDTAYYLEGYIDGYNYQDEGGLDVRNGRFGYFSDGLPTGTWTALYGTSKSYKYRHVLADRSDAKYQYKGTLISADWFQDGLDIPTQLMEWKVGFDVTRTDDVTLLEANYAVEDGWFLEAQVDERIAQAVWGSIAGIVRESSTAYNKVLAAAYAGFRSGSYVGALENFASILLGSEYLPAAGVSRGITNVESGAAADIELEDQTRISLPIDLTEPDRLLPAPKSMPRFHAINKFVSVIDKDLSSIPYLVWMGEEVSNYRFSKRLDSRASDVTTGTPYTYDPLTQVITDYRIDFTQEEVWAGDLIKITLSASSGTRTQFAEVAEILNSHQIRVAVTLNPTSGYGFGPYGAGPFGIGGGTGVSTIDEYTIWTRKTRPVDVFLRLDEALDRLQTSVSGETIQTLNLNIADILKHFCFAVHIAWSRMTDIERLEDLQTFINIFKPADTHAFVYTEAFENTLNDSLTVDVLDYDLDLSVAGNHEADSWRAEQSHFGADVSDYAAEFDLLYNPEHYRIGPKIASQIKQSPTSPRHGEYYLIAEEAALVGGLANPFFHTFSTALGLENTVVHVEVDGDSVEYHIDSGFGPRTGGALRLTPTRRIRVPSLSYTDGDELTLSTWVQIQDNGAVFDSPTLFQFDNEMFTVSVTQSSPGYDFSFNAISTGPTVTSSVTADTGAWVHVIAVIKEVDGLMLPHIYVNGVEDIADSIGYTADECEVPNFTADLFIGAAAGTTAGVPAEDSLDCLVDETVIWSRALTPLEISDKYNSGSGVFSLPIGVAENPTENTIEVLHEDDVLVVLHYDIDHADPTVFDYSGYGNNGIKEGDLADQIWKEDGVVDGPFSVGGDVYEISSSGTYINPGDFIVKTVAFDQSTNDDPPSYNYDILVQSVFNVKSGIEVLTKPNIVFCLDIEQGTWSRMSLITPAVSSAVTLLTSTTPYLGFTDGELVDPFGATCTQL